MIRNSVLQNLLNLKEFQQIFQKIPAESKQSDLIQSLKELIKAKNNDQKVKANHLSIIPQILGSFF